MKSNSESIDPELKLIQEFVSTIEVADQAGLRELLREHPNFLNVRLADTDTLGGLALAMAVIARFRENDFSPEQAVDLIAELHHAGCNWPVIKRALLDTIPCAAFTSDLNTYRFGHLLCGLIELGLERDDELAEWAGGWLADHLRWCCWTKWVRDDPEWVDSQFNTRYLNFSGPICYDLPRALVILGARKYSSPAWGKEQESAWYYTKQIRDPELRKIIIVAGSD